MVFSGPEMDIQKSGLYVLLGFGLQVLKISKVYIFPIQWTLALIMDVKAI